MPKLSAVLITRDEAHDLGRSLAALAFADERLVVDSGSTDGTMEVARGAGARVLEHAFEGFGPQKRWAVAQAAHDWVLCIDADEVVTPELAASIRALLAAGEPTRPAYAFRFLTVFMGRAFDRGALARKSHVRLFDRRRAGWDEAPVHERVVVQGETGHLAGDVLHQTVRDVSEWVRKMDDYTGRGAAELHARGRSRGAAALVLTAPIQFVRHWIVMGNVLNGLPGLIWSLLGTFASVMKYVKLKELELQGAAAGQAEPRR